MDCNTLEITELIASVAKYTKTSVDRMLAMCEALRRIDHLQLAGDIVECGVWRGGNIILARKLSPSRHCWLYDTFTGMTLPGKFDVKASGKKAIDSYQAKMEAGGKWAGVSREKVEGNLRRTNVFDPDKITFIEGPVENTLLIEGNVPERIALLRLDTDWYESTKIEMEVLYPRLQSGGILIVDDYGHWMGCKKAVDEYFGEKAPKLHKVDYTCVMAVKP